MIILGWEVDLVDYGSGNRLLGPILMKFVYAHDIHIGGSMLIPVGYSHAFHV